MEFKDNGQEGGSSCNLNYLLVNLGRNEAAARRLVKLFLDGSQYLIERLESAAAQRDLPALQNVVHDIRGHCVLFSARECLEKSRFLEKALHEFLAGTPAGYLGIDWVSEAADLRRLLQRMVIELEKSLAENGLGKDSG